MPTKRLCQGGCRMSEFCAPRPRAVCGPDVVCRGRVVLHARDVNVAPDTQLASRLCMGIYRKV